MEKWQKIPVGYQAMIQQFDLKVAPHYRASYVKLQGAAENKMLGDQQIHDYPKNYALKNPSDPFEQLEFALKYDGVNLAILLQFFKAIEKRKLCAWIKQHPTGKYTRMAWFLFEMLLDEKLSIPDCKKIKYIDLLNSDDYFCAKSVKSSRHGINNNLLGNRHFCPTVRKTDLLNKLIAKKLDIKSKKIVNQYAPHVISRANHYLLTKETMSSYEIEREIPGKQRIIKFINLLQKVEKIKYLTRPILIECQNTIVEHRFIDTDYRTTQNYVGENINQYLQKVHYISPKPEDLSNLMSGLLEVLENTILSNCHPVVIAAIISFGFVFLHPFEDGNGRLHRFLIHYILSRQQFTPPGIIFPVSAVILKNMKAYDTILESFSRPLMELIVNYNLDNDGILTVRQDTKEYYQYLDFTKITEYLFSCIEETIDVYFREELEFLVNYDKTKLAIQDIVDMPDKLIDLFIRLSIQNQGQLGKQKQKKYFHFLTAKELVALTQIVVKNMCFKPAGRLRN